MFTYKREKDKLQPTKVYACKGFISTEIREEVYDTNGHDQLSLR